MIQVTLPRGDLARLDQIIARFQVDSEEAPAGVARQVTIPIFPTSDEQENEIADRIVEELDRADWTIYPEDRAG